MNKELHFSTGQDEWETPVEFFEAVHKEFDFVCDVCASPQNTKIPECYFTEHDNALVQDWSQFRRCWMNPPYSRKLQAAFLRKAYEEYRKGTLVGCLIPARTDTQIWWDCLHRAEIVRFIKGRLKFRCVNEHGETVTMAPAPFPSALVVFNPHIPKQPVAWWDWKTGDLRSA